MLKDFLNSFMEKNGKNIMDLGVSAGLICGIIDAVTVTDKDDPNYGTFPEKTINYNLQPTSEMINNVISAKLIFTNERSRMDRYYNIMSSKDLSDTVYGVNSEFEELRIHIDELDPESSHETELKTIEHNMATIKEILSDIKTAIEVVSRISAKMSPSYLNMHSIYTRFNEVGDKIRSENGKVYHEIKPLYEAISELEKELESEIPILMDAQESLKSLMDQYTKLQESL